MRPIRTAFLALSLLGAGCATQTESQTPTSEPSASDDAGTWQVESGNNLCILLNSKTGETWMWNGQNWIPMNRSSQ
jgi:hypothetical protein